VAVEIDRRHEDDDDDDDDEEVRDEEATGFHTPSRHKRREPPPPETTAAADVSRLTAEGELDGVSEDLMGPTPRQMLRPGSGAALPGAERVGRTPSPSASESVYPLLMRPLPAREVPPGQGLRNDVLALLIEEIMDDNSNTVRLTFFGACVRPSMLLRLASAAADDRHRAFGAQVCRSIATCDPYLSARSVSVRHCLSTRRARAFLSRLVARLSTQAISLPP